MVDFISVKGNHITYSYKPGIELAMSTMSELSDDDYDENGDCEDTSSVTFKFNAPENLEAWLSDRFIEDGADEEDRLGWFDKIDSNVDNTGDALALEFLVEESLREYMPAEYTPYMIDQDKSIRIHNSIVLLVAHVYAITRRDGEAEVIISAR